MRVDTHISCSSRQTFPFTVWNMLLRLWIAVKLGHTKVNDKYLVGHLGSRLANQKIVGLNVSVNQILFMNRLHPVKLYSE